MQAHRTLQRIGRCWKNLQVPVTIKLQWTDNGPVLPPDQYDLGAIRPAGTIVVPGIYWDDIIVPGLALCLKETQLKVALYYGYDDGERETDVAARLLADLPELRCTPESAAKLRNGNPGMVLTSEAEYGDEAWASLDGKAVAVGIYKAGELHPSRVFNQ